MRLLLLMLASVAIAQTEVRIQTDNTPDGVRFGLIGGKPESPAPTVFLFGGAIDEALSNSTHTESIAGGVLFVSIDLPSHGLDRVPGEPGSLRGWAFRIERGENFITHFVRRASAVLDHLIARNYTDPTKIGVVGISRGGFMGLHLTAADPRVRHVAVFAPVTDLTALTEFQSMIGDHRATSLGAALLADRLYDRAIWLIIGSTDNRVGTRRAIEFSERIIEAAAVRGLQPKIELHVEPSAGHRVPEGSYVRGGEWMRKQLGLNLAKR